MFKKIFTLPENKSSLFATWLLLFTGIVLYLQHSGVPGFFQDGYLYAAFGKNAANLGRWLLPHLSESTYPKFEQHTPFIFMLEGLFFKVFGSGYSAARIFGLLFHFALAFVLWRRVRNSLGTREAFWVIVMFFLIPPLIKKARFPNLDTPLSLFIFCSLLYYFDAFKKSEMKDWLWSGFFMGLAMLTKGPMALLIPVVVFVHIIISKRFSLLISIYPWISLVVALLMFSIWPLSLWLDGNIQSFYNYLDFTFGHTIVDGRGEGHNPFVYLIFYIKQTPIWSIFFLSIILNIIRKREKTPIILFSVIAFSTMVVFLSCFRLKYSNYLIPSYPFLAIITGYSIANLKEQVQYWLAYLFRVVVVALAFALLVFPLTTISGRDRPLILLADNLDARSVVPQNVVNINDAYPYFALANMMAYHYHASVWPESTGYLKSDLTAEVIFIRENEYLEFIKSNSNSSLEKNYSILVKMADKRLLILLKNI